jgi:hypothetical protein
MFVMASSRNLALFLLKRERFISPGSFQMLPKVQPFDGQQDH